MAETTAHASPAFRWRTRVYWEDTDAGGVVYHAGYLRFLERARTEWMRGFGLGQQTLREEHGVLFVVREIDIAYDKPGRLDDQLDATVRMQRLRSASVDLAQEVSRIPGDITLARASVRVACVGAQDWKPCRIPLQVATLIQHGNTHA